MNALSNDLKFAVRQMRKSPGFTAVAILTLALGIGASTAIYSVIRSLVLDPVPGPSPGFGRPGGPSPGFGRPGGPSPGFGRPGGPSPGFGRPGGREPGRLMEIAEQD